MIRSRTPFRASLASSARGSWIASRAALPGAGGPGISSEPPVGSRGHQAILRHFSSTRGRPEGLLKLSDPTILATHRTHVRARWLSSSSRRHQSPSLSSSSSSPATQSSSTPSSSTWPQSPSSKICAVPFAFGPEDAMARMEIAGLLGSASFSNLIYATAQRFLGTWATSLLREFGFGNTVKLKSQRALYYPVWRWQIDANVSYTADYQIGELQNQEDDSQKSQRRNEGEKAKGALRVFVHDGFLPGNAFSPLSLLPFSTQPIPDDIPTYDPASDLTQIGNDTTIVPVDFTVSPFKAMDLIKNRIGRYANWDGLEIDMLKDIEINRLTAYPLYFPLYVSEFIYTPDLQKPRETKVVTIVMDAHDTNADTCRLAVPRPYDPRVDPSTSKDSYWVNIPSFMNNISILTPDSTAPPSVTIASTFIQAYVDWINPPARPPTAAEIEDNPYTAHYNPPRSPLVDIDNEGVEWDDPRIVPWNGAERQQIQATIGEAEAEIMRQDGVLEAVEAESQPKSSNGSAPPPPAVPTNTRSRRNPRVNAGRNVSRTRQYHSRAMSTMPSTPPSNTISPTPSSRLDNLPRFLLPAKPYLELMRLDKPIGTVLLYWPCAWAITLASTMTHQPILVPAFFLALFGIGAIIMRGAGCTINDMWDTRIDRAVDRTKTRPLARGDVTHFQALTFLSLQLSAGLAVLTQLNWYSILLGASSLSLVGIYPLMKRITYYPQFVLGLAFNWGALLGWSAVAGQVDWSIATPLYAAGISWCMVYDTIYAHQDKKDDVLVNVKSTALRFGDSSRLVLSWFATTMVTLLTYVGYVAQATPMYYLFSCAGTGLHLGWQLATVDFESRQDCWSKFVANGRTGAIVWLGTVADYLVRTLDVQWLMW